MGAFTEALAKFFSKNEKIPVAAEYLSSNEFELQLFAIQTAVKILAASVSQCRFRTYFKAEEIKEEEYFLWNYQPNINQNSTEFLHELVETFIYDGEVLVIEEKGQLFIADCFTVTQDGTKPNQYSGIVVNGTAFKNRSEKDVLHFRLGKKESRLFLQTVAEKYEDIIQAAITNYEKSTADKGILNIDTAKRGNFESEKYQSDLLQNKFKTFFGSKSAILPLYSGYTYTPHKRELRNTSEVNDVKSMTDEIMNKTGQIFGVPPTLLKGEVEQNREAIESLIKFGVRPLLDMLEEEITRKRYGYTGFKTGSYMTIDTSGLEISGIFASADKLDKIIGSGILTIDEVREKVGEPAVDTEVTTTHFVTKNYDANSVGKGENNA